MRLSYPRHPPRSMKSRFDLVISQVVGSTICAVLCWATMVAGHLLQIRLRGRVDCGDNVVSKWREWQRMWKATVSRSWHSVHMRIEDRKAGLNDPIWGGARYILGSLGLSALTPLPLTDYKHEWSRVCREPRATIKIMVSLPQDQGFPGNVLEAR